MNATPLSGFKQLALAAGVIAVLSGCGSTMPTMGGNKGVVSGSASGGTTEGNNSQLERCPETLGDPQQFRLLCVRPIVSRRLGHSQDSLQLTIHQHRHGDHRDDERAPFGDRK